MKTGLRLLQKNPQKLKKIAAMIIETRLNDLFDGINEREIIDFCRNFYLGEWCIQKNKQECYRIHGIIKDPENYFVVDIYNDFEVKINGYLLYQTQEPNMLKAWVQISSIDKEAEIIIEDDNYPDKLRKDLTSLIPKITEIINVILEFIKKFITVTFEIVA